MSRRRLLIALGAVALVAVLVVGFTQAGAGDGDDDAPLLSLAEQRAQLAGAPPALAALHAKANTLVPADRAAMRRTLADLQAAGHPVVINKWASWCPPCRLEFPVFQRVGAKLGKQVAFLGLDSDDPADEARAFLDKMPVSYPSFEDRDTRIAQDLEAGRLFPTTVFIDAQGKRFVHQGPYEDDAALERDVRRYALQ